MKFMSWSLNAPTSAVFERYMRKLNDEWIVVDPEGINTWGDTNRNMFYMYQQFHEKISAFGLHEFGVWIDGTIYDFRASNRNNPREWENGYPVLNEGETAIRSWVPTSLQYLMETYTDIEYALQFICFGQKVDRILHLNRDETQETFIRQIRKIAEIYRERWPNIVTIELDFEKTYTLNDGDPIYYERELEEEERTVEGYANGDDWKIYADFIKRVKDEVCVPLNMKLRVNMYAMTGDFNPHYYGWHDYKTLASRVDANGNQAIDEFQLMTYDFSWGGSAPGPSTPQWWLGDVLEHVKDSLPPHKTWIGNAGYGRRWGLNDQRAGNAVTYHQLLMWQNGMYVHNHGEQEQRKWIWHNQSWLPFTGFNDDDSGYQVTYPHLYDKFDVIYSRTVKGVVNPIKYGGNDLITSYFKSQQPTFTGVKAVVNKLSLSGNVNGMYTDNGITKNIDGKDYQFGGAYRANKALYIYDDVTESCVRSPDEQGQDGSIKLDFNLNSPGKFNLIALIHFNTYMNDEITGSLNGITFKIGGNKLKEWFPFYVDQSAWIEVGTFDFESTNTIEIGPSRGYIWGLVVCEDFEQNFLGGTVEFNSYLAPYYKRDDNAEPVEADMPEKMTLTAEMLRRPPRPAIIFEDNFIHLLNNEEEGFDVSDLPYYMKIQNHYDSGNVKRYDEGRDRYICTSPEGVYKVGFSTGSWLLQENGRVKTTANESNQLMLHRKFSCNVEVRADLEIHGSAKAGIRLFADEEGNEKKGYLALLDFERSRVILAYQDGNIQEIASAAMSESLIGLKDRTVTLYAAVHNEKAYVRVSRTEYLSGISLDQLPESGAHGIYVSGGTAYASMFNISTTDRYEPLEKVQVEVDGKIYKYGEVPRTIGYDEYGYLNYSGLDINSTEIEKEDWEEDYKNLPLATVESWNGRKPIRVQMTDAGIWFKQFFIGDSEGFSVAYNSDFIGFVETTKLLYQYGCRGVAMWTIGQEDPLIFNYLPEV